MCQLTLKCQPVVPEKSIATTRAHTQPAQPQISPILTTVVNWLKTVPFPPQNQAKVYQKAHFWHPAGLLGANARPCRTEKRLTNQLAMHWIASWWIWMEQGATKDPGDVLNFLCPDICFLETRHQSKGQHIWIAERPHCITEGTRRGRSSATLSEMGSRLACL